MKILIMSENKISRKENMSKDFGSLSLSWTCPICEYENIVGDILFDKKDDIQYIKLKCWGCNKHFKQRITLLTT